MKKFSYLIINLQLNIDVILNYRHSNLFTNQFQIHLEFDQQHFLLHLNYCSVY